MRKWWDIFIQKSITLPDGTVLRCKQHQHLFEVYAPGGMVYSWTDKDKNIMVWYDSFN